MKKLRFARSVDDAFSSGFFRASVFLLYCIALLLLFDLLYSNFLYQRDESPRIRDARYHHGHKANFDGYDGWGIRYRLRTNSLGFKDANVWQVPEMCATTLAGVGLDDTIAP
jgi:hypothetical protein